MKKQYFKERDFVYHMQYVKTHQVPNTGSFVEINISVQGLSSKECIRMFDHINDRMKKEDKKQK